MCKGRFGLVRHRLGWKQFCCKACLDKYLSDTTREAQRSKHWLEFLVGKRVLQEKAEKHISDRYPW